MVLLQSYLCYVGKLATLCFFKEKSSPEITRNIV
jgi:hypothetical protein